MKKITEASDKWILARLYQTVKSATSQFENFEYAKARESIEDFFWNDFCDNYLEIVKVRSYGLNAQKIENIELRDDQKSSIQEKQQSAILTLHKTLENITKTLCAFHSASLRRALRQHIPSRI